MTDVRTVFKILRSPDGRPESSIRTPKKGDLIRSENSPNHINLVLKVEGNVIHSIRYVHIVDGVKRILTDSHRVRPFTHTLYRGYSCWSPNSWHIVKEYVQTEFDNTDQIREFEKNLEGKDLYWNVSGQEHHESE